MPMRTPPRAALKKKIKNRPRDLGPNRVTVARIGNLESWSVVAGPFSSEARVASVTINAQVDPAIYTIGFDSALSVVEREAAWYHFQVNYRKRLILWLGAQSDSDPTFAFDISEFQWDPITNVPRQIVPQAEAIAALADIRVVAGTSRWITMD